MDKLLLSALTLGCLSMALVYFSLQEPGEPEMTALQAKDKVHRPSAAATHTAHRPDWQAPASHKAQPALSGPRGYVYEI